MNDGTLIIGPAWIGDMVMAQSLFILLKENDPDLPIDVVAPQWCLSLLDRMPQVRRAIMSPFAHGQFALRRRLRLGRALRETEYGRAIVLPNSWKSALVPFFAEIPKRTGWRGEMRFGLLNDIRRLDKARLPLMVDRFNALAYERGAVNKASQFPRPHPAPRLVVRIEEVERALARFGLFSERPALALCPGAEFGPSKRWPADRFAEVAQRRIGGGWQVWIFGSAADRPDGEQIMQRLHPSNREHCHNLAGRTELSEAIDLMSRADLVISNDSGLMHIAAALDRPIVAVYGSTTPDHTPPMAKRKRTVRLGLSCSPCFKRVCPLGHTNCLNQLPATMVLQAIHELESEA